MAQDLFHADALMTSHILNKSSKTPRGIQKPSIEEGQTIQWPKWKRQSHKQRVGNSEHRKMRAKQQHVCKEMNQYKWVIDV